MVRGAAGSVRAIARSLTLCALLAGVFLMHGLPAQSCAAGAMADHSITGHAMAGNSRAGNSVAGHDVARAIPASSPMGAASTPGQAGLPSAAPASGHGGVCVLTPPPRGWAALALLLLLALALLWVSSPRGVTLRFTRLARHRAPPRAPDLLNTLCVSRT
ncbi:hypothetical protein [Amycolatopsis samaneae]|uniref:Uncharacterized protein n=1 Tax=Amycolatopsis samaneae TaxID=664691 RepID=A0ABW5GNF2_9PSEU